MRLSKWGLNVRCLSSIMPRYLVLLKNFMALFYGWGSTALRLQSHFEEVVYFLPPSPRKSWFSFHQPQKDKRLCRPWSQPVVLNMVPLDWEFSAFNFNFLATHSKIHFLLSIFLFFDLNITSSVWLALSENLFALNHSTMFLRLWFILWLISFSELLI